MFRAEQENIRTWQAKSYVRGAQLANTATEKCRPCPLKFEPAHVVPRASSKTALPKFVASKRSRARLDRVNLRTVVQRLIVLAAAVLLIAPTLPKTVSCRVRTSRSVTLTSGRANRRRCRRTASARHIARNAASRSIRCTRPMRRQTVFAHAFARALPAHGRLRHRRQALIGSARRAL